MSVPSTPFQPALERAVAFEHERELDLVAVLDRGFDER